MVQDLSNKILQTALNAGKAYTPQIERQAPVTKSKESAEEIAKMREELIHASSQLNKEMLSMQTDVKFSYNDDIDSLIVTVKSEDGHKVLREIPSKEAIALIKKIGEMVGIIFDKKG